MSRDNEHAPRRMGGPMGNHSGMRKVEKPKNFRHAIVKLIKFMRPFLIPIVIALLCAGVGVAMTLLGPGYLSDLVNVIQSCFSVETNQIFPIDSEKVLHYCFVLITVYGTYLVFSYVQSFVMATVTQKNSRALRTAICKKINAVPLKYFDAHAIGDLLSRVTNDVDSVGQALNQSVVTLVTSVITVLGSTIIMFTKQPFMALTAVGASIIGLAGMFLMMAKTQKFFVRQLKYLGELDGHIEETYTGHLIVKSYNAEKLVGKRFREINADLYKSAWRSQFFSGMMMPLINFVSNFGYVAVCVVGAALTASGKIPFGTVIAFTLYVDLFTSPLRQLAQVFMNMQTAAAAAERIFEFLEEGELPDESGKTKYLAPSDVRGDVSFEHVHFGYEPDKIIINDFSASAKAGQKIAIVGPTGAGKTTMVNLLMRFYEVNSGKIKIDGIPVSELTRENIHDLFCMVLQDTWLFEGTIRENIVYCKEGVSNEDVERACKAVGLHHFIKTMPQGYDTVLNDRAGLSAGQRQLVTIARAMIENAPMLILDEATSSVDTRTEELIQKAMDKLTVGRTSFIIAHRLSTIRNADLILVMKDGDIIEKGKHEELLQQNGFYADLYNSQFETA